VRTAAVDALANLRDARVTPILADLAQNSSDPRVQLRATQGLGRAQPPNDAVEPLRRIAWEHTRLEVQSAAVRALVQIGTEEARRVIAAIAEGHTRPETRRAAVQAVIDQRFVR
jgi:HEAT repeat protein